MRCITSGVASTAASMLPSCRTSAPCGSSRKSTRIWRFTARPRWRSTTSTARACCATSESIAWCSREKIRWTTSAPFIVQDLGAVRLIQKVYPDLEIHGSTQMTVHDEHGARVLRDLGVDRVVLARENTLDDIRTIHRTVPDM